MSEFSPGNRVRIRDGVYFSGCNLSNQLGTILACDSYLEIEMDESHMVVKCLRYEVDTIDLTSDNWSYEDY